jgi:hypothetical protein
MLRLLSALSVLILIVLAAPRVLELSAHSAPAKSADVSMPTEVRVAIPGWWPTKGTFPRDQFVGPETCARCHQDIAETQRETPMAHAVTKATADAFSIFPQGMHFRSGAYNYSLAQTPTGAEYSVTNGEQSASAPLTWIFGNRQFGDTFVYQQGAMYFESRVSYYRLPNGLDFTTGHPEFRANHIETALGRRMLPDEPPLCFGCHSTASSTEGQFRPEKLIPGVTCEACHGPGAQHVAQMSVEHNSQSPTLILNPARLSPSDSADFCGACHRTAADVSLSNVTGIFVLRFPGYRLAQSHCQGAKQTCTTCHNPHKPRVQNDVFYDKVCLSCHSPASDAAKTASHPNPTCKVSDHECVTCHMRKYTIPTMHTAFTDHRIGVQGAQFTE